MSPTPIQSESRKKKKKVSFGLVRVREFYSDTFKPIIDDFHHGLVFECKRVEQEKFCVSDDLICSFQEEQKIKNKICGQQAKVQWGTNVPSESLKFVRCKLKEKKKAELFSYGLIEIISWKGMMYFVLPRVN